MGKPTLTDTVAAGGFGRGRTCCRWPQRWNAGSEHPLAEAIVEGAEAQGVARQEAADFEAVTGKGVRDRSVGAPSRSATRR